MLIWEIWSSWDKILLFWLEFFSYILIMAWIYGPTFIWSCCYLRFISFSPVHMHFDDILGCMEVIGIICLLFTWIGSNHFISMIYLDRELQTLKMEAQCLSITDSRSLYNRFAPVPLNLQFFGKLSLPASAAASSVPAQTRKSRWANRLISYKWKKNGIPFHLVAAAAVPPPAPPTTEVDDEVKDTFIWSVHIYKCCIF